jgi:hypothetical protein
MHNRIRTDTNTSGLFGRQKPNTPCLTANDSRAPNALSSAIGTTERRRASDIRTRPPGGLDR